MAQKQIHLGYALYTTGTNPAGWMPNARDYATDIEYFKRCARIAEAAKLDMIFRADAVYTRLNDLECWSRYPMHMNALEPIVLFSALSQATTHIGLAGTISTSFSEPYVVARQLASMDHISGGRAAWNLVTSASSLAAQNFGQSSIPPHAQRYGRAREYIDVIRALWDTYEDDAVTHDPQTGYYFDPKKFHPVDFEGKYIKVHGGLNIARPPQGYPVTIQAGGSPEGRQLAAETADVVFATNVPKDKAKLFYADVKARTAAAGRNPDELKILPALTVMLGDTEAEARAKYATLDAMVPDAVRIRQLSEDLGAKLEGLPIDEPVPLELVPSGTLGISHNFNHTVEMIRDRMPLREMMQHYRRASAGTALCGTPAQIADTIEEWVAESASDGFNIIVPTAPSEFELFCSTVVPELQRRGSFRKEYTGKTLRDHFGLSRPESRHAAMSRG